MPADVQNRTAPTVGLTGGIASGKSTIARFLRELGVAIVDADQIAREVVAKGSDGLAEVVHAFGTDVVDAAGELDRKKLGAIVFGDDAARARLNGITHPRIAQLSHQRIAALAATDVPYVVYEAALLVENGLQHGFPALIVVAVSEATQLQRLIARDGVSEEEARARLAAQLPLARKVAVATHVIDNDGSVEAARARVLEVHQALLAQFAAIPENES